MSSRVPSFFVSLLWCGVSLIRPVRNICSCLRVFCPPSPPLPAPPCPPQRAKLFKAGVGRDEARRGRSETQVQIRKEKKEERLNQRRRKGSAGDALGGFSFATIPEGGAPAAGTGAAAVETPAHMRVRSCVRVRVLFSVGGWRRWLYRDFKGRVGFICILLYAIQTFSK